MEHQLKRWPCRVRPGLDWIELESDLSWDENVRLNIQVRAGETEVDVALSVEDAREIFNWLGVMLHRQGG